MIVQRFNLNLIPNQSPVIVHVNQYDTGTGRLIATLYERNEPYSPNGTAVIQGTKPDGHGFQYTATLDGNVVTADLTEQMAPVAGDVRTQIVVTEPSGVTGTFAFIIRVQPSALPSDTDMSESDYQYIEEAIREAQEAVQTAQEATETAQEAVERAQEAITETQENAENSEAWAQGTRGGIPVGPTDPTYEHNAEYWAQYAERYAQGGLHYKGSIPFVDIPTTGMREGDMYNITDDFTTDSRFEEGAGIEVKGGTNIAWNSDDKWDVLALPPKTTFNGRSGSILPMAGDYDSEKILLSSILHIGGETQNDVQEALEALSNDGVKSFNGRSGSVLPIAGDYDSEKILLASVLHIGGETQENVQKALEALSNDGVKSFNGRNGSVLPMAGDYSAEQVNYDSNQTVKQKIDALVTKEASDIAGQQSLVKDTVGWTGKNLLKNEAVSATARGVTRTVNSDGSITLDGTNSVSGPAVIELNLGFELEAGTYILSGTPVGAWVNNAGFRLQVFDFINSVQIATDEGSGKTFTLSEKKTLRTRIWFSDGASISNKTFYPMLRKADITDPTYEPYHESVEVMYEEEIHGVNLLPNTAVNATKNGITFTVNTDGSITANGTATAETYYNVCPSGTKYFEDTPYILTGCPKGGTGSTYHLFGIKDSSNVVGVDYGNGVTITNGGGNVAYRITIKNNVTVSNLVFRPMLRKADIEDSTYRPYNEQAIQNQLNAQGVLGAKNLFQITATTRTQDGVTITVNKDSSDNVLSVVLNGTATSSGQFNLNSTSGLLNSLLQKYGDLIWSGCPSRTDCRMYTHILNGSYVTLTNNEEKILSASNNYDTNILVQYDNGVTYNNVAFYPMLRLASDPDDTYQPYAMTNRELTEKVSNTEVVTLSHNTTNVSAGEIKLFRYGKLRILTGYIAPTTADAGQSVEHDMLATNLPSSDAPSIYVRGLMGRMSVAACVIVVYPTGAIKFSSNNTTNMYFNISWLTN